MAESLLRLPQVRARVGLSRSTIYLKMERGEFPMPVSLGARAIAWRDSEVSAWIEQRVAACTLKPSIDLKRPSRQDYR